MIRIIFCILCVRVFVFFVVAVVCLFFPFFSVVGFPFYRQFFSPMLYLLFFVFYTRDFVILIFLKPHSFFTQISLPSTQNGTYVMYGTHIGPTLLHFCLVACYFVTLSKTVNPLAEKPLSSVV